MSVSGLATSAAGVIVPFWIVVAVTVALMVGEAFLILRFKK